MMKSAPLLSLHNLALFLIASGFALTTYLLVSEFKALPCPIFGGDICYQQSAVEHILAGGNPLKSSSILDAVPGYLPLYAILAAAFSALFGLKAFQGMLFFSVVLAFAIPILWTVLLRNFIKNEALAVIGALFVIMTLDNILVMPVLKYTNFTILVMLPLFLTFLYRSYTKPDRNNIALLAFFYSILAISHVVVFVGATLIMGVFASLGAYRLSRNAVRPADLIAALQRNVGLLALFFIIAVPIALLYWYEPIFVYHLTMAYDRTHIDTPDVTELDGQIWFLQSVLEETFLNFSSIPTTIRSALFILTIPLFILAYGRLNGRRLTFLTLLLAASILSTFSYFITEPLLHMNLIPSYLYRITILPSLTLLAFCLIDGLRLPKKVKIPRKIAKSASHPALCGVLFVAVLLAMFYITYSEAKAARDASELFDYARGLMPARVSLSEYIRANTSVNDVFLSSKEMGFMITSLTGRKLVTNRWVHQNDPYTDMPSRDLDAAIMLYGNNISRRIELLEKYDVKYVYWDAKWANYEYQRTSGGTISIIDPLTPFDTTEARSELDSNNVSYFPAVFWVDPAVRSEHIRQYPLLMVDPDNYRRYGVTWEPQLDAYLEQVWSYQERGQMLAALYRVDYG